MPKKYALIFAKTPHDRTPYDQWLGNSDIIPIILTSFEYYDGYKHLEHVHAFNNYDTNHLVEKAAYEIGKKHMIICVFARAESDLIRAAYLRDHLNAKGQSVKSAIAYRDKFAMKNYLNNSSLKVPNYRLINSTYDILNFIEQFSYPIVIKPTLESGSTGITIVSNEGELNNFLSKNIAFGQMLVEEYIKGQMYHVDGLILNDKLVCVQAFKYINTCLSFLTNEYSGNYTVAPNDPIFSKLTDSALTAIDSLPKTKNMAFHAEFWITDTNEIIFCEIASRTGGGMISFIFKHSLGIDLDKEWFLAECGIASKPKFTYQPASGIKAPPFNGFLKYLPKGQEPKYIIASQYCGEAEKQYYGGVKCGLFLAGYVVNGSTESDARKKAIDAIEWYYQHAIWERANEQ